MITRLDGNESLEDEGAAAERVEAIARPSRSPTPTTITTGAPVLLKDLNDYLRGGMLTLGAIAVAIMVVILLVLFDVRWRLLPLVVILVGVVWAFGLAGYLGIPLSVVTIAGLPVMLGVGIDYAIQMHSRIEEEVVIDRAEHPIQEAVGQPRPGAARRHVRRHLRLPRPAVRQGADDPRLRPAAGRRHRRHLPVPASSCRSPSSASASTGRRPRAGTSATARWAASCCGSATCRRRPPSRWRWPASSSSSAASSSRTSSTLQTDPERVGQPGHPGHPGHRHAQATRPARRPSWASSSSPTTCSATRPATFVTDFTNEQLAERPDDLLTASSHRDHGQLPARDARHHRAAADRRRRRARPTRWRRPTSSVARSTPTAAP